MTPKKVRVAHCWHGVPRWHTVKRQCGEEVENEGTQPNRSDEVHHDEL